VIPRSQVTLGILAGGQGRRLGGADKAFVSHRGQPLFERCLQAAGQGFAQRLISHPSADVRFSSHALTSVPDLRPGQPGPLAGLEALLALCDSEWLLTVPVDADVLPDAVFDTLLRDGHGSGRMIRDADGPQPLVALWRVETARALVSQRLDGGQRDAQGLAAALGLTVCELTSLRVGNLNMPADLQGPPA
jgi:molybdenum cofactor guanylyltransferase